MFNKDIHINYIITVVAQWVRAFAQQAEGWVFQSSRNRPKS